MTHLYTCRFPMELRMKRHLQNKVPDSSGKFQRHHHKVGRQIRTGNLIDHKAVSSASQNGYGPLK